jgi:hypothetical protein
VDYYFFPRVELALKPFKAVAPLQKNWAKESKTRSAMTLYCPTTVCSFLSFLHRVRTDTMSKQEGSATIMKSSGKRKPDTEGSVAAMSAF